MFMENCNQILEKTLELAATSDLCKLDILPPLFALLVCDFGKLTEMHCGGKKILQFVWPYITIFLAYDSYDLDHCTNIWNNFWPIALELSIGDALIYTFWNPYEKWQVEQFDTIFRDIRACINFWPM